MTIKEDQKNGEKEVRIIKQTLRKSQKHIERDMNTERKRLQ